MSTLKTLEESYPVIENIILLGADTLDNFLKFRERGRLYADLIDKRMSGVFARLLTKEAIEGTFEVGSIYLVEQAYWALGWYQQQQEVVEKEQ